MRIGIDIDETLTDTEVSFNNVIKKYSIKFSSKYKEKWDENEANYLLSNHVDEILANAIIKDNASYIVNKLIEDGNEIFIITARCNRYSKNVEKITQKFLNINNINIKNIYYGQFKKSDIAKKLKIDLMIDDNNDVCNNMKKSNIDYILFGDKIKTWDAVYEYIKRKG